MTVLFCKLQFICLSDSSLIFVSFKREICWLLSLRLFQLPILLSTKAVSVTNIIKHQGCFSYQYYWSSRSHTACWCNWVWLFWCYSFHALGLNFSFIEPMYAHLSCVLCVFQQNSAILRESIHQNLKLSSL